MRLTLVNLFYPPDLAPTGHLAASLAKHRSELGDEVTVITGRGRYVPGAPAADSSTEADLRVLRLWTPGLGKATALRRLVDYVLFYLQAWLRLLTLPRQDVIITLTTPPFIGWTGVVHKWLHRGTRLVIWNMDLYPDALEAGSILSSTGHLAGALRKLANSLFKHADRIICLDRAMATRIKKRYSDQDNPLPISIIPNWEPAGAYPSPEESQEWPPVQELGLSDRFIILYLGNAGRGHQFDTVLDAANLLREEELTFLFVGGGAAWPMLERAQSRFEAKQLVLHPYVPKEETPAVLGAADCALITMRDDFAGIISPSKMHAALAMGLPILYVGPATTNVDDALQEFSCGVSLRHGEANRLAEAVRRLMRNAEYAGELSTNALSAFHSAYSEEAGMEEFDRLLDSLFEGASS